MKVPLGFCNGWRLLACMLVGATLFGCASAMCMTLDLKGTLRHALENSPSLDSFKRELHISDLEVENAFSSFLPSMDASAIHGIRDAHPPISSTRPWLGELSLGIKETLYDNGVSLTKYQLSKLKRDRLGVILRNERDKLCLSVLAEYLRYSLAMRLQDVQTRQNTLLERQHRSVASQYRQGYRTRKDFLRFETQLKRSKIDLLNRQNAIDKSRLELVRLAGIGLEDSGSSSVDFVPDTSVKVVVPDFRGSQPNLEDHYEYEISAIQRMESDLLVGLERRKYWPEVFLTSGISYDHHDTLGRSTSSSSVESVNWNILLTLNFNLWDWGRRRRNVAIAEQKKLIEGNGLDSRLLEVRSEIGQLILDLEKIEENFRLSQELLKLEERSFSFLEAEYRRGKVPYLDLITGLNNLSDAEVKYFVSLFELKEGVYRYWYHKGRLYEKVI